MNDGLKTSLHISQFMGTQYPSIADDVLVVQVQPYSGRVYNTCFNKTLLILISALFSFGCFRSVVQSQLFNKRMKIYTYTIIFWMVLSVIGASVVLIYTSSVALAALTMVAIMMLSYSALQMIILECDSLRFMYYYKNETGLWIQSAVQELQSIAQTKFWHYYSMPIIVLIKKIKFIYTLWTCRTKTVMNDHYLDKYIKNSVKDSEILFVVEKNRKDKILIHQV